MMRSLRFLAPVLLVLALLAPSLSGLAQPAAHAAPAPALQLPANAMLAGAAGSVTVHGTNFTPWSAITLRLDDTLVVGSAQAGPRGAFTATATVPAGPAGQHSLAATDAASLSAAAPLYVVNLTLSPNRAPNGMHVAISGTGFLAAQPMEVRLGGAAIVSCTPDGAGAFSDAFMVPAALSGQQPLVLQQGAGPALVLRSSFTISQAALTLSLPTAGPGQTIAVSGTGFAPEWDHTLHLDGQYMSALHTNGDGAFGPIPFTVPLGTTAGQHMITMRTSAGHTVASAAVAISVAPAALILTPVSGVAGGSVQVTGAGFLPGETVHVLLGTSVLAAPVANAGGQMSAVVTLPQTLTAGTVTLRAVGQISQLAASAVLTIPAPSVSLSHASILPGLTLTVTGRNFAAHEAVVVALGGTPLATVMADGSGGFVVNLTVPVAQTAGAAEVAATGQIGQQVARANLAIVIAPSLSLNASTVPEGGTLIVTGAGFGPGEPVVLRISGFTLQTVTAGALGTFSAAVTIPATAPISQLTLTATGLLTQRAASAGIAVTLMPAQFTLSTGSLVVGAGFQVSGTGFRPGEQVQIAVAGRVLATVTTNDRGEFTNVTVTLPSDVGPGAFTISASGLHSQKAATAGLTVIARSASLSVSPSTFTPGTRVRIEGGGFLPGEQVALSINGSPLAAALAGGNGAFVLTASLPAHLSPGSHQIAASGVTSRIAATASVQLTAPTPAGVGSTTWYFAAGRTDGGYSEQIDVLNTNTSAVHGTITFFYGADQTRVYPFTLQAQSRGTYDAAGILGVSTRFATAVAADLPIAAARTSHRTSEAMTGGTGVSTPSRTWYMAEGYTGLTFQEELDLLNPGTQPAQVHIAWTLFNGKAPIVHNVVLAPRSHLTISVNSYVDRASHATVVTADQPIVAGRTMLFGLGQQGAHALAGATQADTSLYFAEGSTNNGFEEYLTILNPHSGQTAQVTASFFDREGTLLATRVVVVDAMHRANIKVNEVVQNSAIATVLHSSIPIVAERSMYFGAPNGGSADGTVVSGRATPALGWAFASGDTGNGRSEFELLFNPNGDGSTILATFYGEDGRTLQRTFTVPGHSRLNIDVTLSVPELVRGLHGVVLQSTNGVSFVAEQALYANTMHNGSATVGTPIG